MVSLVHLIKAYGIFINVLRKISFTSNRFLNFHSALNKSNPKMSLYNYDNEKILIGRLKIGDENAYQHLYKLYYAELCTYLHAICGNMDLSKDLAQQAFIKIWKKMFT